MCYILVFLMPEYDEHNIRARLYRAYQPVFDLIKKLETIAEKSLVEFRADTLDADKIGAFIADLTELENTYDEFLDAIEETSQGLEYESRLAKNILSDLRKTKEMFNDIRIQIDSIKGFIKPGLIKPNDLLLDILRALNSKIKKLRETISEDIRFKIQQLFKEQSQIEHLFPDDKSLEEEFE